jgi:hypothetical protein
MNSAPAEGAERIRAEADPSRGPEAELFGGDPRQAALSSLRRAWNRREAMTSTVVNTPRGAAS